MAEIVEFLFGHTADVWTEGNFVLQTPLGGAAIAALVVLLIILIFILYRRTTTPANLRLKTVLILLRSLALIILLLCLLQPMVTISSPKPRESFVGLLIDSSNSMSIRDMDQALSRGETAMDLLYGEDGLIERLRENFTLRIFSFDRTTRPLLDPEDASFSGSKTHTAMAMRHAAEAMEGLPFEALVLVTDGIDNSSEDPLHMASILQAGKTPVHVIGVGVDTAARDIEISQVSTSGSVMEAGIFEVHVTVQSHGYTDQVTDLLIEFGEEIVSARKIKLGPENTLQRFTFHLTPIQEGALVYSCLLYTSPSPRDED